MHYGLIQGTLVSTQKVAELQGYSFKVLVPCDEKKQALKTPSGEPLIAIDPIGARDGDLVLWVGKREASLAIPGAGLSNQFPVDAAVTGIIDAIG